MTGDKSLEKVKSTLLAIRPENQTKYGEIRILVVGDRQGSYSDGAVCAGSKDLSKVGCDFLGRFRRLRAKDFNDCLRNRCRILSDVA